MSETLKQRLTRLRKERNFRRKDNIKRRARRDALNAAIKKVDGRIRDLNAGIKKTLAELRKTKGDKAADYLLGYVGQTESPAGSNDAPFLRKWEDGLPHNRLDWMIPGQPWCGFAVLAAWYYGAGKLLPDNTVYTPAIVARANSGDGFTRIDPYAAKRGDLVVFDFDGGGADHVGLALGPAKSGSIPTVEGNTSAGDGGSQSNGGGVFQRLRPLNIVVCVARPK